MPSTCPFCAIVSGAAPAHLVDADESTVAFLDKSPLLHGHVLLVPRLHVPTLLDLPDALCGPVLRNTRRLAAAVETALAADGSFVAINTRISQSVHHLHIHIVPRWRKDGLFARAMVWIRRPYASEAAMAEVAARIRAAMT